MKNDPIHLEEPTDEREALAVARIIVNHIGNLYYERIPSQDWVRVRQETNDELDKFVAKLILSFRHPEVPEPQSEHFHIWSELPCKAGECRMEPQGEPTDVALESLAASLDVYEDVGSGSPLEIFIRDQEEE